jgi:tetratricopeptide (TPR) repeat protein
MRLLLRATLTLGLVILVGGTGRCQITPEEALSKFVSAGMAYKEGRYDVAISQYMEILQGGRESGPLYYNLGNSYFKKADLGQAVLNYERAKKFIPRDSDLKFNDRYVQSQMEHYGNGESQNIFQENLRNFIQFYTIDEMVIILLCLAIGIGGVFLGAMYFPWPPQWRNGTLMGLLFVLMVFMCSLIAKISFEKDMAVIKDAAESYFEPRSDSTVHYKLSEGMKVKVLKTEGAWIKIQRRDGKVGWIDTEVLEKIELE